MPKAPIERRITHLVASLRAWGERHRRLLIVASAGFFLVGLLLSASALDLSPSVLDYRFILLILVVGAPLSILLNANELQLCANLAGRRIALRDATAITTIATVSNLLPLPASLAIRGGALVGIGATVRETGAILVAAGLMWIAMALAVSGFAFAPRHPAFLALGCVSLAGVLLVALWIGRRGGSGIALGFVAVRTAMTILLVLRLWLAFAAIGAAVAADEAASYVIAGVAGTVVLIVPAGLGVSEGLAAAMAELAGGSAAAAFLALGLNRLLGLVACGAVATATWRRGRGPQQAEQLPCA